MTFLKNEVKAREICETVMSSSKGNENKRNCFQNYHTGQTYTRNYLKQKIISTSTTLLTQIKNACIFCDWNSRNSMNCKKLDIEQKISKLKSQGLCWTGYKSKHLNCCCKLGNICKICFSKFHHKSVCKKNYKTLNISVECNKENNKDSHNLYSDVIQNERTSSSASEVISSISQCNLNTNCSKNGYLLTCTVLRKSEKKSNLSWLMFYCGSSCSIINQFKMNSC